MLTAIRLDDTIFPNYKANNEDNALENLSKINIFIGANNSGKSRLLRTIFSDENFYYTRDDVKLQDLNGLIIKYHDDLKELIQRSHSMNVKMVPLYALADYKYLMKNSQLSSDVTQKLTYYLSSNTIPLLLDNRQATIDLDYNPQAKKLRQDNLKSIPEFAYKLQNANKKFEKTYIPILRGLRPIHSHNVENSISFSQNDDYYNRTKYDYFKDTKIDLSISTGLGFYNTISKFKNGDDHEVELAENFEKFLGDTFFQGEKIRITPHKGKDVVTFKVGNEESRPIFDLGDGIQAIIILTYPLFFNQGKDMIFFFEEPETNLHPGFQRIFIETLLRPEFESFQYFFTTHSNHFLDITLDHDNISIYNFRKGSKESNTFSIENVKNGNINVLQEIGVRNASVFLSNCTIWVEGITDRIYIRKYLEVYMKSKENTDGVTYREDYHYSFVEYSGGNVTHWSFLENQDENHTNINVDRVCSHLFLVTDQDGAGEAKDSKEVEKKAKQERHEKLKTKLGDNYHCLECREIENSLSPEVIIAVIKDREVKTADLEIKSKDFEYQKYQDKKLGKYIEDHILNRKRKFQDDSGTIYDKLNFAKSAVEHIDTIDDLSPPALDLIRNIFNFIKKHN